MGGPSQAKVNISKKMADYTQEELNSPAFLDNFWKENAQADPNGSDALAGFGLKDNPTWQYAEQWASVKKEYGALRKSKTKEIDDRYKEQAKLLTSQPGRSANILS